MAGQTAKWFDQDRWSIRRWNEEGTRVYLTFSMLGELPPDIQVFNGRGCHLGAVDYLTMQVVGAAIRGRLIRVDGAAGSPITMLPPNATAGTFCDRYNRGEVTAAQIDDAIDRWHDGGDPWGEQVPLHDYLGFSWPEYQAWAHDPASLPRLIAARIWS